MLIVLTAICSCFQEGSLSVSLSLSQSPAAPITPRIVTSDDFESCSQSDSKSESQIESSLSRDTSSVQRRQRWHSTSLPPREAEKGTRRPFSFFNFRFDAKQNRPVGSGVSARTAGFCGRDRRGHAKETKGRHERRKASSGRLRLRRGAPLRSD